VTVYKNGLLLEATHVLSFITIGGTSATLTIADYDGGTFFNGIIDEAHVSADCAPAQAGSK